MLDVKALLDKFMSYVGNIEYFPSASSSLVNTAQTLRAYKRAKYTYWSTNQVEEGFNRYGTRSYSSSEYSATWLAFYRTDEVVWIYVSLRFDPAYDGPLTSAAAYPAYQGGYSARMIYNLPIPAGISNLFSSWSSYEPIIYLTEHLTTCAATAPAIAFNQSSSTYEVQWTHHSAKRVSSEHNVDMIIVVIKGS